MERRFFTIELRAEGGQADGQAPVLRGYAAVFDQLSVVLYGMFREKIAKGAFAGSLRYDFRRCVSACDASGVRAGAGCGRYRGDCVG